MHIVFQVCCGIHDDGQTAEILDLGHLQAVTCKYCVANCLQLKLLNFILTFGFQVDMAQLS